MWPVCARALQSAISADLPLRGFVLCNDWQKPLTACWSTSKTNKNHPYYRCQTKGSVSYLKSIRRDVLETTLPFKVSVLDAYY